MRNYFYSLKIIYLLAITYSLFFSTIYAHSDKQAIDEIINLKNQADKLSDKLWSFASKIDNALLGSSVNEIHVRESSCYIIGKILNKEKIVQALKPQTEGFDFKSKTSENAYDLRISALILDNFSINAERILDLSAEERIQQWNLDCVGEFDIPASSYIEQKNETFYQVIDHDSGNSTLRILGNIEPGFYEKITQAIENNPNIKVVALGSAGGSVRDAILSGYFIRSKNLDTVLWNNCYSACPLVFMGGVKRDIWSPYPNIGFHQVYTSDGTPIDKYDDVYRTIYLYLEDMGIKDPLAVLEHMWAASPSEINIVDDLDDLCEVNNIATWIQRACW